LRGRFFLQSLRAGILALLVTPDAVVRFVERAGEVGALVAELVSFALAQMGERVLREAALRLGVDRDEAHEIELGRRLEQHSAAVPAPALGRGLGPGGIAG